MSQAISSRWPLTAENRFRYQSGPRGICGRQTDAGVGLCPEFLSVTLLHSEYQANSPVARGSVFAPQDAYQLCELTNINTTKFVSVFNNMSQHFIS